MRNVAALWRLYTLLLTHNVIDGIIGDQGRVVRCWGSVLLEESYAPTEYTPGPGDPPFVLSSRHHVRARPALRMASRLPRYWRTPPVLLRNPATADLLDGVPILAEHRQRVALLLQQCYRDLLLWAESPRRAQSTVLVCGG